MFGDSNSAPAFEFQVEGSDVEFGVASFQGHEGVSDLFHFELDLVAQESDIDFDQIFSRPARLTVRMGSSAAVYGGLVCSFLQANCDAGWSNYQVILVPRLWLLTLSQHSRIFQERTVPQIVAEILNEHGFVSTDFDASALQREYPQREYVVQYQETDFNFLSRWLEHEGIFYFFSDEKLIFMDNAALLEPIGGEATVPYRPASGMESGGRDSVRDFVLRRQMLPKEFLLKDYNWRKPKLDLRECATMASSEKGLVMEYGNHFKDSNEGQELARIRKEENQCRRVLVEGSSSCSRFRPGFCFTLSEHFRPDFNNEYLLTEVQHFGSQSGGGLGPGRGESSPGAEYGNRFVGFPSDAPYRPMRKTPRPRLHGAMNAKVDGTGDGHYAEIDEQGRYKLVLPFDISAKAAGKASRYVRMAQPYAGQDYGIHFPLHKDVEVIWTCIDGDVDRPIICGAVPNPEARSPVTSTNQATSVVRDYGGNEIVLDGSNGKQQIRLYSPTHRTTITLGSSITACTDSDEKVAIGNDQRKVVKGDKHLHVEKNHLEKIDGDMSLQVGGRRDEKIGNLYALESGQEIHLKGGIKVILESDAQISLKVGGSFIDISPSGIAISGALVRINSGGSAGSGTDASPKDPQDPEVAGGDSNRT